MSDLGFIHQYVPGAEENSRVLLLLHGTGGDESDLLSLGRELDPTATLLSPRGKVSENGAPRFFRRFAEGAFDETDVIFRANELADFVVAAVVHYHLEDHEVIAVGYSNGANIAAAMILLRPEVLRQAILFRAMVPLSKPAIPDLAGARVMISVGESDPIIPLENVRRLAGLLSGAGAEVSFQLQHASHNLVAADLLAAKRWLGSSSRKTNSG